MPRRSERWAPAPAPFSGSLGQLHRCRAAAGSNRDFAEALHQHDVGLRPRLIGREGETRQHLALPRRHVVGIQPVEGEYQHVPPAGVAPAELGELRAQQVVFPLRHFPHHVRYPTTDNSRATGHPVNVEPVVPVRRTLVYVPIHDSGPSTSTTLFARVRVCSSPPRFANPSTSTSCTVPTSPTFLVRARRRTTATSRSSRSPATSSGTASLIRTAGVPSRGEYLKVYASSKPTLSTRSRVSQKSASVSPGNPTMMSVVRPRPGRARRNASTTSTYRSRV